MIKIIITLFGFLMFLNLHAQKETGGQEAAMVQPTIMAIPFSKKGESIRKTYEEDDMVRIAITKVKEAFDSRGVNTIDFRGKLKQLGNTNVLTEDQESTLKDEVIALSGADIYVEVEARITESENGNSATVVMTAYDAFSGESLANKVGNSPSFYTDQFEKLIEKAVESEVDNFLNTIQEKFTDMIENGRTVVLNIGIEQGAGFDLDAEMDDSGYFLSELIEEWVVNNAYKNYAHLQGTTSTKMIFDIVKVPLKTERGRPYRVSRFAVQLRKYLNSKGLEADRVINGNNIVLTIREGGY